MKPLFIIAPYFPPSALPPSQRVRLLVGHCRQYGFNPYVFTVDPKFREEIPDEWMVELTGQNYIMIKTGCLNQKITRKLGFGDLGLRMAPFLFFKVLISCIKIKPKFILYPVPPWHILLIAPIIKLFTGVKYGIDFIDPWVHEDNTNSSSIKYKFSQWVARNLEGWVTRNASVIFSVSEGINDNLIKRHPLLSEIPMTAIPYGAESNDFKNIKIIPNSKITIRYIGAIWNDCYPVLDGIMPAFTKLNHEIPIALEFYGTSYAGPKLAQPQLQPWFDKYDMQSFANEFAVRVPYKDAVQLTMSSDLLFLIGGMQPYYSASKLMGLIVSEKPFLAFVHEKSFPAIFLKKTGYPYLITYSSEKDNLPTTKTNLIFNIIMKIIHEKNNFKPLNCNDPLIAQHTAIGMTKDFLTNINNCL